MATELNEVNWTKWKQLSEGSVMKWQRFIRVNFIDCLHSFRWMKLNQLKFIAHLSFHSIAFNPFTFVGWMNDALNSLRYPFNHSSFSIPSYVPCFIHSSLVRHTYHSFHSVHSFHSAFHCSLHSVPSSRN